MPPCTMKFSKAEVRRPPKVVDDVRMAMHVMEARDDLGDVELWEGSHRLCSVEAWGPSIWRIRR